MARVYRVLPQLEVAGYYIDLVVEGTSRPSTTPPAVEGDGKI